MKLDDVRDLFAYLKTLPAVQADPSRTTCRFPFNIRRTLGVWKFLFLDGKPFVPDPSQGRGVESRRLSGQRSRPLRRVPFAAQHSRRHRREPALRRRAGPGGDGFVPNITQKGLSCRRKSSSSFSTTGETPDGDTVGGEMGKVVANTAKLSDQDRAAIATYVKSLPPVQGPKPPDSK